MRNLITILVVLVSVISIRASAEPVVVALDGDSIYIDLGARDGVGEGTQLELLHEVVARDPRTNLVLRDRFSLGTLTVVKSGDRLSVARAEDDLGKRVVAGDHVRLISAVRKFADPWADQVAASKVVKVPVDPGTPAPPVPGEADHVELVHKAWQDTLGRSPEDRIERWTALLAADPRSPYHKVIDNEIVSLRAQIAERAAVIAKARSAARVDREPRIMQLANEIEIGNQDRLALIVAAPIERVVPARDLVMSFLVRAPGVVKQGVLYVRAPNTPGFKRIELAPDGDANLRATIERAMVRGPRLEWYLEAVTRAAGGDEVVPVLGSQQAPRVIEIEPDVTEAPIEANRTHIDVHADYVDFDGGLNKGFDQYYQGEIDFTYRFLDPIYAVRLGFGTLAGKGGPKDVIDLDPANECRDTNNVYQCKKVSFSYVYLEFEHRIRPNVALMIRPQAGLLTTDTMPGSASGRCSSGSPDSSCDFHTGVGLRGRLRLGNEDGTNLVLGAGFTSRVGTLFEAAYNWRPTKIIPVQLTVQVTDMPTPENFGVRLIGDVGLRQFAWFYPSLRLSYQARDIDHAGVSGGFAMNFDW